MVKILNLQEALGRGPGASAMTPILRHTSAVLGGAGGRAMGESSNGC